MAEYLIQDTSLTAIADSIREKTGGTEALTPEQMATEIQSIEIGVEPFAVISASYPTGNTCTCANETTGAVLTTSAVLVDGKNVGFFTIPCAGSWVVTITDGTQSKSEQITIATQGQIATVELDYDILYIISEDRGLAIGYSTEGDMYEDGNTVCISSPDTAAYAGYLTPAIDLTNYKTLHIDAYWGGTTVGLTDVEDDYYFDASATAEWVRETVTINVSSMSGGYYFGAYANGYTGYITIYNLWLTK